MTLEEHNIEWAKTLKDLGFAVGNTIKVSHPKFEGMGYEVAKIVSDDGKHEMRSIKLDILEEHRPHDPIKRNNAGERQIEIECAWFNRAISGRKIEVVSK